MKSRRGSSSSSSSLPTLISTLLHPLCPTMSHSLVTYLVPAYLESQHRVQFQELGNSWPVTRLECIRIRAFHTLFRYTRSCVALSHRVSCTSGKISVGYTSLETILRLSLIFVNKLVFLLRSSGER